MIKDDLLPRSGAGQHTKQIFFFFRRSSVGFFHPRNGATKDARSAWNLRADLYHNSPRQGPNTSNGKFTRSTRRRAPSNVRWIH